MTLDQALLLLMVVLTAARTAIEIAEYLKVRRVRKWLKKLRK